MAQSDKKLLAIIETDNGQKFYKVGDTLDNGFVIQFISLENVTVDISNGTKNIGSLWQILKLTEKKQIIITKKINKENGVFKK